MHKCSQCGMEMDAVKCKACGKDMKCGEGSCECGDCGKKQPEDDVWCESCLAKTKGEGEK